ncbi:MAG: P-II family nitrogen regulator [Verrucomicrobiia bacterium]
MNRLTAIIRPAKLKDVTDALLDLGIEGMTVTEVRGCGRQKGQTESYRGQEYTVNLLPKVQVDVVLEDSETDKAIEAISKAAATGAIGDGRIFVSPVATSVRIRTNERTNS